MAIHIGEKRLVCVSEQLSSQIKWGYFQFPQIRRRASDGAIIIMVHDDQDANFSVGKSYFAMISTDGGKTFARDDAYITDILSWVETGDGRRVGLGFPGDPGDYSYPCYRHDDPQDKPGYFFADAHGLLPVQSIHHQSEQGAHFVAYRLGDYPEQFRDYPVVVTDARGKEIERYTGRIQDDDMEVDAMVGGWDWANGGLHKMRPRCETPAPNHYNSGGYCGSQSILILPDGTWLMAYTAAQTVRDGAGISQSRILQSTDEGRTWTPRAVICADEGPFTNGHTNEHSLARLADGTLLYAVRLCESHQMVYTHALAIYLSRDDGHTWTRRSDLSECSVKPSVTRIGQEAVIVSGRPGVYVRATRDGVHFSDSYCVIGIPEDEQPMPRPQKWWDEVHHRDTCANTTVLKTGEKSMLLTYSDFHYKMDDGFHKAIYVVEITAD